MQDELLLHIRSIEALGIAEDSYGAILTPLILSHLPEDVRIEWAKGCADKESDLSYLLTVLKEDID